MNPKNEWFKLKPTNIKWLFSYYVILLIIGIVYIVWFINDKIDSVDTLKIRDIFFISIVFSVLGSVLFYIRKLYKACINSDMVTPVGNTDSVRELGVIFYFILRPVFALIFCLLTLFIIKSGISILSEGNLNNNRFFYFSIITSFIIGYSCGDYIDQIERIGKRVVERVTEVKL